MKLKDDTNDLKMSIIIKSNFYLHQKTFALGDNLKDQLKEKCMSNQNPFKSI